MLKVVLNNQSPSLTKDQLLTSLRSEEMRIGVAPRSDGIATFGAGTKVGSSGRENGDKGGKHGGSGSSSDTNSGRWGQGKGKAGVLDLPWGSKGMAPQGLCHGCWDEGHAWQRCPHRPKGGILAFLKRGGRGSNGKAQVADEEEQDDKADGLTPPEVRGVRLGDGRVVKAAGMGEVPVVGAGGQLLRIQKVHLVPEMHTRLLSVSHPTSRDVIVTFKGKKCVLKRGERVLAIGEKERGRDHGLVRMSLPLARGTQGNALAAGSSSSFSPLTLAHRRLGHTAPTTLQLMARGNSVLGLEIRGGSTDCSPCEPCLLGKSARKPFPHEASRALGSLDEVHMNLWGPVRTPSQGGVVYVLSLIDDFTRRVWSFPLPNKESATVAKVLRQWHKDVELECGRKLKAVRSDRGGEFLGDAVKAWKAEFGIKTQLSVADTPQQNGVMERWHRTMAEGIRTLLVDSGLPARLWGEALMWVVWVKNRVTHSALPASITSMEAWSGQKPHVGMARIWGCMGSVMLHGHEKGGKLDARAVMCVCVGVDMESKGWRMLDPSLMHIRIARDVDFLENVMWKDWDKAKGFGELLQDAAAISQLLPLPLSPPSAPADDVEMPPSSLPSAPLSVSVQQQPTPLQQLSGPLVIQRRSATQATVDLPPGKKAIGVRYVFRRKTDKEDKVVQHKVRLVAKGYTQEPEKDYDQVFAPVGKLTSGRVLLAEAAVKGWHVQQEDVDHAYLNAVLQEEVYVRQPEGFDDGTGRVYRLHKALYGLKQAPRAWNEEISTTLIAAEFDRSACDEALYIRFVDEEPVYVLVYVDDLLLVSPRLELIDQVKEVLAQRYQMKDLGEVSTYLGVEVRRSVKDGWLEIGQEKYVRDLQGRFGDLLKETHRVHTPMSPNDLSKIRNGTWSTEESVAADVKVYQSLIGSLMYAAVTTRPDMSFTVNTLAQSCVAPRRIHMRAALRALRGAGGGRGRGRGGRGGRGGGAANMKSGDNDKDPSDDRYPGLFYFVSTQVPAGPEKDEGFEEPAAVGKVTLHPLDYWVIDSGATYSMTPRPDLLTELEPSPVKHVTSALGQRAEVKGMGKAMFKGADGKMVGLKNVLWVPSLAANLISVRRLAKAGMDTNSKGAKTYTARLGDRILWDLHEDRDVYNEMWQIPVVPMPKERQVAASVSTKGGAVGSGDSADGRAKEKESKKCNLGGTSKFSEPKESGAATKEQQKGEENPEATAEEDYGESMWGAIASAAFSNPTSATGECDWLTLHRRMGHVALPILQQLVKNEMVAGIRVKGEPDEVHEGKSFMVVYVDDILIFSPSSDLVKEVMLKLQDKFKCKALGDMSFYLGLHIEQDVEKRCMRVHQRKYLEALAANFGQSEGHVATPFPSGFKCVKGPEEESVGEEERRRFHSLVGSLMYAAVNTRPDVAFATGQLARVVQCPNEEQVAAGMRVAKYLGQTPTVGLQYSAAAQRRQKGADGVEPGRLFLTAYSDASYASEPEDMTSVGGFICCVGGGPTAWESKKQVDQALSSVESEYMALFRAVREIVWQRRLLAELGEEQPGPTPLYCDSQGAIALAKNPVLHGLTKHMRVKWHWTRSMVTAGEVELRYVKTTGQPADMMTKRLVEQQHWKCCKLAGMALI
ncbi:unnamed protein product [Closterium sp. NIES-54]